MRSSSLLESVKYGRLSFDDDDPDDEAEDDDDEFRRRYCFGDRRSCDRFRRSTLPSPELDAFVDDGFIRSLADSLSDDRFGCIIIIAVKIISKFTNFLAMKYVNELKMLLQVM